MVDLTLPTRTRTRADREIEEPEASPMLGRYRVQGLLGRGGMGVVYSGFDEQLERRVAIKRVLRRSDDELARRRSLREAQALARLAHPNIVTVYEAFEDAGQLCIVMELVVGSTLRTWLADGQHSSAEVLAVLIQAGHGIAAAHAVGLVHRDLKPDNIMIGDDGRVRVMDFGLARAVDDFEPLESTPTTDTGSAGSPSLTRTGALIGTPGYMAPEHYLGLTTDALGDLFSFCVLAFEALHGQRPFAGRGFLDVRQATLAGKVAAVEAGKVPAWLDRVLRRGLAIEPGLRWPSMDALLDALARDPIARRRRQLRGLGMFVLVGALVVVAWSRWSTWQARQEAARVEAVAEAHRVAVEATIADAEATGDDATADAAFRAYVLDPQHQGTRALTHAWLARGDRQTDPVEAKSAYAEAFVSAPTLDDEREALRRLAAIFHADWDGLGLDRSIDLLRVRGANELRLAEMDFDAALWQRDLGGAKAALAYAGHSRGPWFDLLDHLSSTRSTGIELYDLALLPAGTSARVAVLGLAGHEVVLLDDELHEVDRRSASGQLELVPNSAWAVHTNGDQVELLDLIGGDVLARGAPKLHRTLSYEATGDGVPELFFGRIWPDYGFRRWDASGRTSTLERDAHPGTDASDSALETHTVGDLDGDGVEELVVAFGPWHRFDLRVFRPDAYGELELISQLALGRVGGLAMVHREERLLLAALVDNSSPAPELFPEPPHLGSAIGVHLFEWVAGELVEVEVLEIPHADRFGRFKAMRGAAVGDLDGDGREDLALEFGKDGLTSLLLVRQTAAGFESELLTGIELFGGMQLDADPSLELLVRCWPDHELVVLGLGDEPLAAIPRELVERRPAPSALVESWLIERWQRADELAMLELYDSAATSLRDAAMMVDGGAAKSVLLDRSSELFAEGQQPLEVLSIDPEVHHDPRILARARARRVEAHVQLGHHEDARVEAETLLGLPELTREQAQLARAWVDDFDALLDERAQIDLRFDRPLAREWLLHTPGALRRDPSRGVLEVAIPATRDVVAELPIEWRGGPLSLEFELELTRLEFGACFEIMLLDANDALWLGAAFCGMSGGGVLMHNELIRAGVGVEAWTSIAEPAVPSALHPRTVDVRLTYFPARGRVGLSLASEGALKLSTTDIQVAPAPGRGRLTIGSIPSKDPSLAQAELHRLRVRGARVAVTPELEGARARPALLLAEQQPHAALEALALDEGHEPRAILLGLIAYAQLGDLDGLARTAERLALEDLDDLEDLAVALRVYPLARAALVRAAKSTLLPTLAAIWAHAHEHRKDALLRREALEGLAGVEDLEPTNAVERDALRRLLVVRAELWEQCGELGRAGRDRYLAAMLERE